MALCAAFMWAIASILYKLGLRTINIFKANLLRSAAALSFMLIFSAAFGRWGWLQVLFPPLAFYAIANVWIGLGAGDCCYFSCIKRIGVSRATPLAYSYPFFVLLLATILLKEAITPLILAGTISIVAGVYFVSTSSPANSERPIDVRGVAYGILTSFFWALSIYIMKLATSLVGITEFNTGRLALLIPLLLVLSLLSGEKASSISRLTKREAVFLALGGISALGIGDLFLIYALFLGQASLVAPLSATQPLFAILLASLILREKATKRLVVGAILVVLGASLLVSH